MKDFQCYTCKGQENVYKYAVEHAKHIITELKKLIPIEKKDWITHITKCKEEVIEKIKNKQWTQLLCIKHSPFKKQHSLEPCPTSLMESTEDTPAGKKKVSSPPSVDKNNKRKNMDSGEKKISPRKSQKTTSSSSFTTFESYSSPLLESNNDAENEQEKEEEELPDEVLCKCDPPRPARCSVTRKEGPNKGREFYGCLDWNNESGCGFFLWKSSSSTSSRT